MKKLSGNLFYQLALLLVLLVFISSCIKRDNNYIFFYPEPATVTDADGNVYHTIYVKGQTWLVENLKTTHYHNGDTIAHVPGGSAWGSLKTGAWCSYNKDTGKVSTYGRLYNWYAVNSGKLCPYPFHVPFDFEWQNLADTLGGIAGAGGILKEAGSAHWQNNTGATNLYGFTARPGGCADSAGIFRELGTRGYWWSSTPYSVYYAWPRFMRSEDGGIYRYDMRKESGFSVRCIRDY